MVHFTFKSELIEFFDNYVQTTNRYRNSGSRACRTNYSVDYEFCYEMLTRDERGHDQNQWFTVDLQLTNLVFFYVRARCNC